MAVHSSTFGSTVLTDDDAKKFKRQVTYGRPKASAKASVASGVKLAQDFRHDRRVTFSVTPTKR